jgi:hypothetical protein
MLASARRQAVATALRLRGLRHDTMVLYDDGRDDFHPYSPDHVQAVP